METPSSSSTYSAASMGTNVHAPVHTPLDAIPAIEISRTVERILHSGHEYPTVAVTSFNSAI